MAPKAAPIASISSITIQGFQPARSNAAETVVVKAITPLTERSIPPEITTNVSPIVLIKRKGVVMNKVKNTCPSRMPG